MKCGRLVTLVLLLLVGALGSDASASFISMQTTVKTTVGSSNVVMVIESTNQGDESAHEVRLEALFPGGGQSTSVFPKVAPSESVEHTFEWEPPAGHGFRQAVIPVVTHYADANLYRFSALTYGLAAWGPPPVATVSAKIEPVLLVDSTDLILTVQSTDGLTHSVSARLIVPAELNVEPRECGAAIPAHGTASVKFRLRNFSALGTSRYVVWAVLAEPTPFGVVEQAVVGNVEVGSGTRLSLARWRWLLLGAIGVGLVVYIFAMLWRRLAQRSTGE